MARETESNQANRSRDKFRVLVHTNGLTDEIFQGQLGRGWIYEQRLTRQDGAWVVAELRVFPESSQERSSMWDKDQVTVSNVSAELPRGGLTARLLREVRFGRGPHSSLVELDTAFMNYVTARQQRIAAEQRERRANERLLSTAAPVAARMKRDIALAETAKLYVEARRRGSRHPNLEVARVLKMKPEQVRDAIHRARTRGLLTSDGLKRQGAAKGELTKKAEALLANRRGANVRTIAAQAIARAARNSRSRIKNEG